MTVSTEAKAHAYHYMYMYMYRHTCMCITLQRIENDVLNNDDCTMCKCYSRSCTIHHVMSNVRVYDVHLYMHIHDIVLDCTPS